MSKQSSVETALGNLAFIIDIIPTRGRPKLGTVEPGTPEFDYMLATLVFDMAKKNAWMHKALRKFALHADPDVAREVLADVRAMEEHGQDYEALAHATERRMLEAINEVVDDHVRLGEVVVRWDEGTSPESASSS